MEKKPNKAEEPQVAYPAKQPEKTEATVRYATPEQTKQAKEKIFRVHKDLLRKLAQ